jgi:hypothetical protein
MLTYVICMQAKRQELLGIGAEFNKPSLLLKTVTEVAGGLHSGLPVGQIRQVPE